MDHESLRDPVRIVSTTTPQERTVVLHAVPDLSREPDGGEPVHVDSLHYPVVSITAVVTKSGAVYHEPVIVVDGFLQTMSELRDNHPSGLAEVVVCDWPKHCDEEMLGRRLRRLANMAGKAEVRRLKEVAGKTRREG